MKSIQTIFFGLFLTGWFQMQVNAGANLSIGDFFTSRYKDACKRLQTVIDASSDDLLPFLFSRNAIKDLNYASPGFIETFVITETELQESHNSYASVTALMITIDMLFEDIDEKIKSKTSAEILYQIKEVDPLGLDAFLDKIDDQTNGEYDMDDALQQFSELMADRFILFQCMENPSIVKNPLYNADGKLHSIPEAIRKEIATEDAVISEETLNYFLDIAALKYPKVKIYRPKDSSVHDSPRTDGLRIMFGGRVGTNKVPNWIFISYDSITKKLHVYDTVILGSYKKRETTHVQEDIIKMQFPDAAEPIIYEKSATLRAEPAASGVYAMIYACTSLMGENPAKIKFKLNTGYGDKCLFMRLHLLQIFANKRLAKMD